MRQLLSMLIALQMLLVSGIPAVRAPAAAAPKPTPGTTTAAPPSATALKAESPIEGYAAEVLRLVNAERKKAGLRTLSGGNGALNAAAQKRAVEINPLENLSHTRPNGKDCSSVLKEYPVGSYGKWGENLAWGQVTPAETVADWMASPAHRANLLNAAYTHLGVGVYKDLSREYSPISWAQLFIAMNN